MADAWQTVADSPVVSREATELPMVGERPSLSAARGEVRLVVLVVAAVAAVAVAAAAAAAAVAVAAVAVAAVAVAAAVAAAKAAVLIVRVADLLAVPGAAVRDAAAVLHVLHAHHRLIIRVARHDIGIRFKV